MGWETRARGGRYYTRSRRVEGRVVREYVGAGRTAELAAQKDAQARAERRAQAEAWHAERADLDRTEQELQELCDISDALARAALMLAGYHRHKRGEWRRKRG